MPGEGGGEGAAAAARAPPLLLSLSSCCILPLKLVRPRFFLALSGAVLLLRSEPVAGGGSRGLGGARCEARCSDAVRCPAAHDAARAQAPARRTCLRVDEQPQLAAERPRQRLLAASLGLCGPQGAVGREYGLSNTIWQLSATPGPMRRPLIAIPQLHGAAQVSSSLFQSSHPRVGVIAAGAVQIENWGAAGALVDLGLHGDEMLELLQV